MFELSTLSTNFLSYPQKKTIDLLVYIVQFKHINSYEKLSYCVYLVGRIRFHGISAGKFKLMNNFIKYYGILRIRLGICGVSLFICVYQESEEKMSKELKTQWHPAFVSAMKLELIEDAEYLDYTSEYNLNTKPLEMDLLIVKKEKDVEIKNEIGKIFRRHNIVEYKSPDDSMNLNTYMKVIAYACLYKAYENHVDEIELDEITITMVREKKPVKLFQWFEMNGYQVEETFKGIYYVIKENLFLTQIIVSKELSKENQKWLTLLSKELDKTDVKRVVRQIETLTLKSEKSYVDSVLQVAMKENKQIFGQLKEEEKMCQALREFFEPELNEAVENKRKEMIWNALNVGSSVEDISRVMGIPLEEIEAIAKGI